MRRKRPPASEPTGRGRTALRPGARRIGAVARKAGLLRDERGATLVFVAVAMTAALSILALAVDLAMLYVARSEAQRAADSAALAGASAFLQYDPKIHPSMATDTAEARALEYALLNTIRQAAVDSGEVRAEVIPAEYKIRVTVRRATVPLTFGRIFGIDGLPVSAHAAAVAADANLPTDCVKPFGIPDLWHEVVQDENSNRIMDFGVQSNAGGGGAFAGGGGPGGGGGTGPNEVWGYHSSEGDWYDRATTGYGTDRRNGYRDAEGNTYDHDHGRRIPLKWQQPGQGGAPSNWQALDLRPPGSGADRMDVYQDAIQDCVHTDHISVGGQVSTMTGQFPEPTRTALDELIAKDPDAYWDDEEKKVAYPPSSDSPYSPHNTGNADSWLNSPRVFTAVLIAPFDVYPGDHMMDIADFTQFFVEDPAEEYPDVNPSFQAPITGRLIRFAPGGIDEGGRTGTLIKVLRLVE